MSTITEIDQQITELQQRRVELAQELAEVQAGIKKAETSVGAGLLAKKGVDKIIDEIARGKGRAQGITVAQQQLTAQLIELETKRAGQQREADITTYEQEAADVQAQLYTCVQMLDQVNQVLGAISLPGMAPKEASKAAALATNMLWHLRSLELGKVLQEWERIAPEFMAAARQEKV